MSFLARTEHSLCALCENFEETYLGITVIFLTRLLVFVMSLKWLWQSIRYDVARNHG